MRRSFLSILFVIATSLLLARELSGSDIPSIVPKPVVIKSASGTFLVNSQTPILMAEKDSEAWRIATYFTGMVKKAGGPAIGVRTITRENSKAKAIFFEIKTVKSSLPDEGYELKITPAKVVLKARTGAGLFHGIQTLLQLIPAERTAEFKLPAVSIIDYPRFPYRGMHLDVSRHFFPKEFVLKYIDLIAIYKMNTFHWHLTDDNGWRIEIKKYPRLTQTSAWRVDHEDKPWGERAAAQPGEKATYGGFYTQDEIREVVKYAADRYINIIPEIEMPAHVVEVLAAYPQLSCTGGPFTVPTGSYWPNLDIFCAGNDSVFTFLQDVLTEVMELFPSRYIHVGGDEADKTNWKKCVKCQQRITQEGLKDERELQSYFMRRMEKFINAKGRKMIGWDEILEGGIAPGATVMSWRGLEGGIAAARQGHDAIMTPTPYCYFDYYQADPDFEPKSIGGFTTLKKVYSFNPVPEELTKEEAKHILGAQGNVWTEFIPTTDHAEYMAVPRMIALAEVVWSPQRSRNWDDFRRRMTGQYKRLENIGVNYSNGSYKVSVATRFDKKTNSLNLLLTSEQTEGTIRYTLSGDDVTNSSPAYSVPVEIKSNGIIKAGLFADGKLKEKVTEIPLVFHHAIGKPVKYLTTYSGRYPAAGASALTDGLRGSNNHRDGLWQGFLGNDLEMIIDLGREMPVNAVQANFLQNQRSWIFLPAVMEYSLSSDGRKYHSFNEVLNKISPKEDQSFIQPFNFQFMSGSKARYIRVKAKNLGKCPEWHEGKGEPCWLFADEIVVF